MRWLALTLSVFVAVLGAIGIARPEVLPAIARNFQTPAALYAAGALRIVLGIALFLAASASRAPRTVRALGIFIFVAGLITPFIGVERVRSIVDWWSAQSPIVVRSWAGFALAFGGFLAWALLPKSSVE